MGQRDWRSWLERARGSRTDILSQISNLKHFVLLEGKKYYKMMELNFVKSQYLFSHSTLCFKELLRRVLSSAMIELNCDSLKHLQNEVKRSEKKFSFYSMIPLLKYQPKISTSLIHLIFLILNHFYKAHLGTPSITDNVRMYLFFKI